MNILAVFATFAGAGLRALLRSGLGFRLNPFFPTLPANLPGGLPLGLAAAGFGRRPRLAPEFRLFAIAGLLGGLTTFSTFSADLVTLLARSEYGSGLTAAATHWPVPAC